jgi:hypothetical protein
MVCNRIIVRWLSLDRTLHNCDTKRPLCRINGLPWDRCDLLKKSRQSHAFAWLPLLGMLLQLAFSVGHFDGPDHREGYFGSAIEDLFAVADANDWPASHDKQHGRQECAICLIASLGVVLPMPAGGSLLPEPIDHAIRWFEISNAAAAVPTTSNHAIRGPPSQL